MNQLRILILILIPLVGIANNSSKVVQTAPLVCQSEVATKWLRQGYELQKDHNTEAAYIRYTKCLEAEPSCVACLYELGWSLWKKGEWDRVISIWENALALNPEHQLIQQFLPTARENLKIIEEKNKIEVFRTKTNLLIQSEPLDAPVVMTFVGRWQAYSAKTENTLDHYDLDIDSPKSVVFGADGKNVYVNSLEGGKTVVFKSSGLEKMAVINHQFVGTENFFENKAPFNYQFLKSNKTPNAFLGKPVESVHSHHGKFLWVTYYRRSYDSNSTEPSAMALVDTETNKIIRVFGTGPIAKYVQVSTDNELLAVSNWGDNTVGLYDISGNDPKKFKAIKNLVVETQLNKKEMTGNRDKNCGFCVRGLAFTKDSRYLFVARMKKGGIAIFDLKDRNLPKYLGTINGIQPGTRDLQISPDGEYLYAGCNASGYIAKMTVSKILDLIVNSKDKFIQVNSKSDLFKKVFAGLGVRSMKLTDDGKYLFTVVNQGSELQVYDTLQMKKMARIAVDSFPVGLGINPEGSQVWVTSQGRNHKGGNSVSVFQVQYKLEENISKSKDPRLLEIQTEGINK